MKKTITLLLACLLICTMAVPCLADEVPTMTLKVSESTVNAGDTITVTVSISETANCTAAGLGITYDTNAFEMVEDSFAPLIANTQASCKYNSNAGGYVANIQLEGAKTVSGDLFTFQLKVKDGAKMNATYSISGTPSIRVNGSTVSGNVKAASISVACTHAYDNDCDTTCNLCGATRAAKHTWDDGKVTTEATCTAEGVKTFACTACGATKTETVAKKDHTYDKGQVTKEATCTDEGVKTFTCTACGKTKTQTIESKGHSYDSGVVNTEATCTDEGVKTFTCTACGKTKTERIAATGHTYDHDCDTDCNVCGETRETEHNYSDRWSSDETGHWHECISCGEVLELMPHTPGPDPTEKDDQICLDCGFVLQLAGTHIHAGVGDWLSDDISHWHLCACGEILESQEHTWNEGALDEAAGVITYTCTVCGHPKTETVQQPTESTPATQEQPTTQPSGTEPSATEDPGEDPAEPFPWWIVILIVGILLAAAAVFIIVGILKSKKQTGKYTG